MINRNHIEIGYDYYCVASLRRTAYEGPACYALSTVDYAHLYLCKYLSSVAMLQCAKKINHACLIETYEFD